MDSKLTRKVLVGAVALALAVTALPSAMAQAAAFGGQVKVGDGDLTYVLAGPLPFVANCFVDDDGSGTYNPGEAVYANTLACGGAAGVAGNDLRLTSAAGQAAGTQVRATHSDFGDPTTAFPGGSAVAFYDADGDGVYSLGDPVYLDIGAVAGAVLGTVTVGDLRITPWGSFAAATVVASGNSDINNAVVAPAAMVIGAWDSFDSDGDGLWTNGDVAYIDADGNGVATIIDIRLGAIVGKSYGTQLLAGDGDLVYVLAGPLPFVANCFVDDDGSGTYNPGESVYANTLACGAAAGVAGNDLRLTAAAGQAAGTQVRATHSDFGDPTTAFPGGSAIAFYDADGDGVFGIGDPVYIDIGAVAGAVLGTVTVGDLRITPFGSFAAASVVSSGNGDINNAVVAPAGMVIGAWDSFDADGDGLWTSGDVAYIDADATGTVTIPDVRLGAIVGKAYGTQVMAGDGDLTYVFAGPFPFVANCFVDDDGSGTYNPGEAVYANTLACGGAAGVAGNDLRLTAAAGQAAGTQVRATHSDFGDPTTAFPGGSAIAFYDADGDGVYSLGDPVYIDIGAVAGAVLGTVTVGDLRLTSWGTFAAASVVSSGNSDINNAVVAPAVMVIGAWDSFDADGDGLWTNGDVAYIDADAPVALLGAAATIIDIRLGGTVPAVVTPPGGTPPTTPPGTPPTTPPGTPPTTPPPADEMAQLRAQLATLLDQNTKLNDQLQQSLQQNTQLQTQVGELNKKLGDQSTQITTLSGQITKLSEDNKKLNDELAKKGATPTQAPGFEAIAALAAIGAAGFLVSRRKK